MNDEEDNSTTPGTKRRKEESPKRQVETALSKITAIPEDNQSLLSSEVLEELRIQAIANEESLPATFLSKAAPHLHSEPAECSGQLC